MAPNGAALAVQSTELAFGLAGTIRIISIDKIVAVVVDSVRAVCLRGRRRAAVVRTVALIFTGITEGVTADRRRAAVDLAVVGVLDTLAGAVTAAILRRRVAAEETLAIAARVRAVYRIGTSTISTAELLLRCTDLLSIAVCST